MLMRTKSLLLTLTLSTAFAISISAKTVGQRWRGPLIRLQSSERLLDNVPFKRAIAASPSNGEAIYALDAVTGAVSVHYQGRSQTNIVATFGQGARAFAVGPLGNVYVVDSASNMRIVSPAGETLNTFSVASPSESLAVLSNGNVIVSAPVNGRLLHLYSPTGQLLSNFGEVKIFDSENAAQNQFLNRGKVVIGPSGEIYYVFRYAPTVQKFTGTGQFVSEFVVQGTAVDLQLDVARRFLSSRSPTSIGGIHIIRSAAVDPVTGHLWLCLNGSSHSGVIYEYNAEGEKLREYAISIAVSSISSAPATSVRDLAVRSPWLHAVVEDRLYRININSGREVGQATAQPRTGGGLSRIFSFLSERWRSEANSYVASAPMLQATCPQEVAWPECTAPCPGGTTPTSQNCKAALQNSIGTGLKIVAQSCEVTAMDPKSCNASVTTCDQFGALVTHTTTLQCNNCPEPKIIQNGNCVCPPDRPDCRLLGGFNETTCQCNNQPPESPVVVDVSGNGFDLTNQVGGVEFDLDSDGTRERLSWTTASSDDAWLALDRNSNGRIDDGRELFGNFTPQPPTAVPNGFLALAEYDKPGNGGNGDGRIDSNDVIYSILRLWQDTNHNGISEPEELRPLSALGVTVIELDYRESRQRDRWGNEFRYRVKVYGPNGQQLGRWAYDVFLLAAKVF